MVPPTTNNNDDAVLPPKGAAEGGPRMMPGEMPGGGGAPATVAAPGGVMPGHQGAAPRAYTPQAQTFPSLPPPPPGYFTTDPLCGGSPQVGQQYHPPSGTGTGLGYPPQFPPHPYNTGNNPPQHVLMQSTHQNQQAPRNVSFSPPIVHNHYVSNADAVRVTPQRDGSSYGGSNFDESATDPSARHVPMNSPPGVSSTPSSLPPLYPPGASGPMSAPAAGGGSVGSGLPMHSPTHSQMVPQGRETSFLPPESVPLPPPMMMPPLASPHGSVSTMPMNFSMQQMQPPMPPQPPQTPHYQHAQQPAFLAGQHPIPPHNMHPPYLIQPPRQSPQNGYLVQGAGTPGPGPGQGTFVLHQPPPYSHQDVSMLPPQPPQPLQMHPSHPPHQQQHHHQGAGGFAFHQPPHPPYPPKEGGEADAMRATAVKFEQMQLDSPRDPRLGSGAYPHPPPPAGLRNQSQHFFPSHALQTPPAGGPSQPQLHSSVKTQYVPQQTSSVLSHSALTSSSGSAHYPAPNGPSPIPSHTGQTRPLVAPFASMTNPKKPRARALPITAPPSRSSSKSSAVPAKSAPTSVKSSSPSPQPKADDQAARVDTPSVAMPTTAPSSGDALVGAIATSSKKATPIVEKSAAGTSAESATSARRRVVVVTIPQTASSGDIDVGTQTTPRSESEYQTSSATSTVEESSPSSAATSSPSGAPPSSVVKPHVPPKRAPSETSSKTSSDARPQSTTPNVPPPKREQVVVEKENPPKAKAYVPPAKRAKSSPASPDRKTLSAKLPTKEKAAVPPREAEKPPKHSRSTSAAESLATLTTPSRLLWSEETDSRVKSRESFEAKPSAHKLPRKEKLERVKKVSSSTLPRQQKSRAQSVQPAAAPRRTSASPSAAASASSNRPQMQWQPKAKATQPPPKAVATATVAATKQWRPRPSRSAGGNNDDDAASVVSAASTTAAVKAKRRSQRRSQSRESPRGPSPARSAKSVAVQPSKKQKSRRSKTQQPPAATSPVAAAAAAGAPAKSSRPSVSPQVERERSHVNRAAHQPPSQKPVPKKPKQSTTQATRDNSPIIRSNVVAAEDERRRQAQTPPPPRDQHQIRRRSATVSAKSFGGAGAGAGSYRRRAAEQSVFTVPPALRMQILCELIRMADLDSVVVITRDVVTARKVAGFISKSGLHDDVALLERRSTKAQLRRHEAAAANGVGGTSRDSSQGAKRRRQRHNRRQRADAAHLGDAGADTVAESKDHKEDADGEAMIEEAALRHFRNGEVSILVSTEMCWSYIAGVLHNVPNVVNYNVPLEKAAYNDRIMHTNICVTLVVPTEQAELAQIEENLDAPITRRDFKQMKIFERMRAAEQQSHSAVYSHARANATTAAGNSNARNNGRGQRERDHPSQKRRNATKRGGAAVVATSRSQKRRNRERERSASGATGSSSAAGSPRFMTRNRRDSQSVAETTAPRRHVRSGGRNAESTHRSGGGGLQRVHTNRTTSSGGGGGGNHGERQRHSRTPSFSLSAATAESLTTEGSEREYSAAAAASYPRREYEDEFSDASDTYASQFSEYDD